MVYRDNGRDTEYGGAARGPMPRVPKRTPSAPGRPGVTGASGSRIGGDGTDASGVSLSELGVGDEARIMRMQGMRPTTGVEPTPEEIADRAMNPELYSERVQNRKELDQQTGRYWRERNGEGS